MPQDQAPSAPISSARARTIASEWHTGQRDPIYAFMSSGFISPDVIYNAAMDREMVEKALDPKSPVENHGWTEEDIQDLCNLEAYLRLNGPDRPPQEGWSELWEERT